MSNAQVDDLGVPSAKEPVRFLGFAWARWTFALRIWLAMVTALFAAFWLELASASSAAVCVAILALPFRGHAFQKAAFRFGGTLVGFVVSVAITGLFAQARDLVLFAYAIWLAACVFIATLLDGNRAYGAVLSGYTVAILSINEIDDPQSLFESGANRCAAEAIGIIAIALIYDLLRTPDIYPNFVKRVSTTRQHARDFVLSALRGEAPSAAQTARSFDEVISLNNDIEGLAGESPRGRLHAAAARSVIAAIVSEMALARDLLLLLSRRDATPVACFFDDLAAALARKRHGVSNLDPEIAGALREPERTIALAYAAQLMEQDRRADAGLRALRRQQWPERDVDLPIHRNWRSARRHSLRVFMTVILLGYLLVLSGWPRTSLVLLLVSAFASISANRPNPRAIAEASLIAFPAAIVCAGVAEYLLLDGADAFPLLAISLAPFVLVACLLQSSPNPRLSGVGFLLLVFFPVVLSPANPEDYDPRSYLTAATLTGLAALGLFVSMHVLLPTSARLQRRWIFADLRDEVRKALMGRSRKQEPQATFRAADRIVHLAKVPAGSEADEERRLRYAFALSDIATMARRAHQALDGLEALCASPIDEAASDLVAPARLWDRLDEARSAIAEADAGKLGVQARLLLNLRAEGDQSTAIAPAATALLALASVISNHADAAREYAL